MDQGWALYSWAIENDGWLQFSGMRRSGHGYVGQLAQRLVKQALDTYK